MYQKYFSLCCMMVVLTATAGAQNVSSPYSILGIGDIENNDFGRYNASGGAAVSRREAGFYNFSNPASLTAIPYKNINFDFSSRGRFSKFKMPGTDTFTLTTKDMVVKRVTIAFKVTPSVAFAFGIRPLSSVNYQFSSIAAISDGDAAFLKYTDGSGGINQTYFSIAKQLSKRISVGTTASWLFGSLQNSTQYYNPSIGLDITRDETNFYTGAGIQGGLQYHSLPGKKWQHNFGVTATAFSKLNGENTSSYTESGTALQTTDPSGIQFKMPASVSAGYSIAYYKGLSLHLQGTYNKWPTQKLAYKNAYTKDNYGIYAGMEYSKKIMAKEAIIEKYYIAWGIKMEQSYLTINAKHLDTYAASFGGGRNISRFLTINAGIELGQRGTQSLNQIQENYFQFNIGLTLKDIWFGTRKFGRFN